MMIVLTKGLLEGERHAGVGAQEVVNGWELFEVRRPAFQDEIQRDSSEPVALSNAELAALPPVAAALDALRRARQTLYNLGAGDLVGATQTIILNEAENLRAALAQFAEPEPGREGE